MANWGRGLLGLAGGAGQAAAAMGMEQIKQNHETERANALATKQEALARLTSQLHTESQIATEDRAAERSDETSNEKFRINGKIPTNRQIRENAADNEAVSYFDKQSKEKSLPAETAKAEEFQKKGGLVSTANIEAVRAAGDAAGKLSAEDQEIKDSYDAAGKLVAHSDEVLAEKTALATQLMQSKIDMTLKVADMRYEQAKELAAMKQAGGKDSEYKAEMLKVKQASARLEAANAAAKYSTTVGDNPTPEQAKILNNMLIAAGEEPVKVPAAEENKTPEPGPVGKIIKKVKGGLEALGGTVTGKKPAAVKDTRPPLGSLIKPK